LKNETAVESAIFCYGPSREKAEGQASYGEDAIVKEQFVEVLSKEVKVWV